jgi:chromosome segregation ATPase
MTFAEEIRDRKAILGEARNALTMNTDLLTNALEVRILELESDLDNAHEDLENEKALTKKLKGLLDGKAVMVSELLEALEACTKELESMIQRHNQTLRIAEEHADYQTVHEASIAIAKAYGEQP